MIESSERQIGEELRSRVGLRKEGVVLIRFMSGIMSFYDEGRACVRVVKK